MLYTTLKACGWLLIITGVFLGFGTWMNEELPNANSAGWLTMLGGITAGAIALAFANIYDHMIENDA